MRLAYLCPDTNVPTGGIKVIYRHAQAMAQMGVDAHVMHLSAGFRCDWFPHSASTTSIDTLRRDDVVVVPEVMAKMTRQLREQGMRYVMYVQNGYLVLPSGSVEEVEAAYRGAELVLSISDDTSSLLVDIFPFLIDRVLRLRYSVDAQRFAPTPKRAVVTYMPRKLPQHSANVVPWLQLRFPHWQFFALHGLTEDQVASALSLSRIFLAFSDFEGCPVPPVEAALAGNLVLGYPGWGGREYWHEPNFYAADFGDVRDFVRKFHALDVLARSAHADALIEPGRRHLQHEFSRQREEQGLLEMRKRLGLADAGSTSWRPDRELAATP